MTSVTLKNDPSGALAAARLSYGDLSGHERRLVDRFDHVSSLPNRKQLLGELMAGRGDATAIVLVTLADAAQFNATLRALGHGFADEFVRQGAARIRDVVGPDVRLFHVSVLSIAFLVRTPPGKAPPVVPDLVDAFVSPVQCFEIPIRTRVGIGIASLTSANGAEVLRTALTAAQASRGSPCGWAFYDRKSDERHRRAYRILADFPGALADPAQLHLVFQPRISLQRGRCAGAEALLRWTHPELGTISPGEFVPLIETTAMITPLTGWVIRNAMAQAADWRRAGLDLALSVNVSPRNLGERDFTDWFVLQMDGFNLPPDAIEIECTEGMSAGDNTQIITQMERLRHHGIDIAIDDFGTGYSNMSYLTKLPATTLKIDQAFVREIESDNRMAVLVGQIVELARKLGLTVVAEGIETPAQHRILVDLGCDEGQGFLYGKPMTADDFLGWLHRVRFGESSVA